MTKFKLLEDLNHPEYQLLVKGAVVYLYSGPTYGCCDYNEIAITVRPNETPFLGVYFKLLEEVEDE